MSGLAKQFWDICAEPADILDLNVGDTVWMEMGALRSMHRVTAKDGDNLTFSVVFTGDYDSVPKPRMVIVKETR